MTDSKITIATDERDWIAANWKLAKEKWLWRRVLLEILGLWSFLTLLFVALDTWTNGWHVGLVAERALLALVYALVAVATVVLVSLILLPKRVRKSLHDHRRLAPETRFAFDAEGFQMENVVGTSRLQWAQLAWWSEDRRMVMLVYSDTTMVVIAKSDLGEETLDQLRAALRSAKVPNK